MAVEHATTRVITPATEGENGFVVANKGLQVVGGRGYVRGHRAERLVRDARAGDLMALTAQQCRDAVGRSLLDPDA